MLRRTICALLSLPFVFCTAPAQRTPWVTGYYGYWGEEDMPPPAMRYQGLTHLVHFFARPEMSPSPYFGPVVNPADSMQLVWGTDHYTVGTYNVMDSLLLYSHRNGVKVVLSIGGIYGTQAEVIDFITHDSSRTQAFVDAALGFARRHGYDGVELDWERPMSAAQVSLIIRRLRAGLNAWPARGLLVVASAGWDMRLKTYDPALVAAAIDQFNIMGYDLHMPGNLIGSDGDLSDVTGFNAALHRPDSTRYPVIYTLSDTYDGVSHPAYIDHGRLFLSSYNKLRFGPRYAITVLGFPPEKIGIGIPFYGYIYKNRTAPNQPRAGSTPAYLSYKTTLAALRSGGTRTWDEKAGVPWAAGTATAKFGQWGITVDPGTPFYITYDDTASVRLKVRWAQDLHLGGIMLYDLWYGWVPGGQPQDPLLRTAIDEISRR
ncbi:MAG TPA: glycoside hydrolase family 18 protein [Bacteroidota bacterium]|nr:glycoside hydrolase family 18 protein [Bacteroidota bacterium]